MMMYQLRAGTGVSSFSDGQGRGRPSRGGPSVGVKGSIVEPAHMMRPGQASGKAAHEKRRPPLEAARVHARERLKMRPIRVPAADLEQHGAGEDRTRLLAG